MKGKLIVVMLFLFGWVAVSFAEKSPIEFYSEKNPKRKVTSPAEGEAGDAGKSELVITAEFPQSSTFRLSSQRCAWTSATRRTPASG